MSQDWFWEGNIRGALARHLERQGWQVAPMAEVEQGTDLIARRDNHKLLVQVKGYPSAPAARGPSPKAGQPRPMRMASKARQWYADALLGVMLKHHAHPDAEIALALPAHRTYRSLIDQTTRSLGTLGAGVFLVSANGDVETLLKPRASRPHQPSPPTHP